jgi:peptidoglycan DL-endopeptidase CwlO
VIGSLVGTALCAPPASAVPRLSKPPAKSALDQQISDASNQLEIVVEQYDSMTVTLAATKKKEARVKVELAPMRKAEAAAHAKIAAIAEQVYLSSSPAQTFGQLLDASSTSELVNQLGLINQIAYTRRQQIDALNESAAAYLAQQHKLTVLDNTQTNEYGVLKAKKASILGQIAQLKSLRLTAYGPSGMSSDPLIHYIPIFTGAAGAAVKFAYEQLGKTYRFGAAGPNAFDCSGLTMTAWQTLGVNLPHSAAGQYQVIKHVTRAELQPGDLVFYYHPIHHVGIYVGDDKVINAPTYGEPVKVSPLNLGPIAGYGRP